MRSGSGMCDVYLQEVVRQVADRDLLLRLDGGGAVQQLPPPAPRYKRRPAPLFTMESPSPSWWEGSFRPYNPGQTSNYPMLTSLGVEGRPRPVSPSPRPAARLHQERLGYNAVQPESGAGATKQDRASSSTARPEIEYRQQAEQWMVGKQSDFCPTSS